MKLWLGRSRSIEETARGAGALVIPVKMRTKMRKNIVLLIVTYNYSDGAAATGISLKTGG